MNLVRSELRALTAIYFFFVILYDSLKKRGQIQHALMNTLKCMVAAAKDLLKHFASTLVWLVLSEVAAFQ